MAITTLQTVVVLTQDASGTITSTYTVIQGCDDFPGKQCSKVSGTITVPSGSTGAIADLIAAALAAAASS